MIEINIKGQAGSGKTTIANAIHDFLSRQGFNVMLIEEFDKVTVDQELQHKRIEGLKSRNPLIKVKTVQSQKLEKEFKEN